MKRKKAKRDISTRAGERLSANKQAAREQAAPNRTPATGIEPSPATAAGETGRYAYDGLDRTIHEKARLGILSSLAAHPSGLLFGDLKDLCSLTDGNLSRHMQTLQEAGLVEVWKRFQLRRPQTLCRLTELGRQRLLLYIGELERVVADAATAARQEAKASVPNRVASRLLPGWSPG